DGKAVGYRGAIGESRIVEGHSADGDRVNRTDRAIDDPRTRVDERARRVDMHIDGHRAIGPTIEIPSPSVVDVTIDHSESLPIAEAKYNIAAAVAGGIVV